MDTNPKTKGTKLIFRRYRVTKDGKRVYPKKAKALPMEVKE